MIGKKVTHYTILEELGAGGMGVVYKARDEKLDRLIALKFLSPDLTRDPEVKKRFIHEAQAAAALEHNHICNIHEIGESCDQTFIVMAYYEGETLKKRIQRGPLKIDEAISIAIQIADGLNEAHEKNIVHRDVKSANIMITPKGQAKILDFGLAKLAGRSKLTKTGTTIGTVAYMSPEQARGEDVDRRADIWSLGVILYEMITGRPPFEGDYEQAVVYSILNEEPESVTGLRTGVPIELERIINKCIEKKVDDRYQHACDVIVDLRKVREASQSSTIQPSRAAKRRFIALSLILILIAIFISGYFFINTLLSNRGQKLAMPDVNEWVNSIAVLPFENMSPDPDQEYFCDGMTEQIINNLSQIGHLKVISRTSVMKFKGSERRIPEIAAILNVRYILEGSVRKYRDQIRVTAQLIDAEDDFHVWSDDFDRALIDIFQVQDEISENIVNEMLKELPEGELIKIESRTTGNVEAYEYYLKGKYYHENKFIITRDEESFALAEMMFKKAISLDSSYALPHTALADLYHSYFIIGSNTSRKPEYFKLLNAYVDKAFGLDSSLAYNYLVKGRIHVAEGNVDEEFTSVRKAFELAPNVGWFNVGFARFFQRRGLYQQAIPYVSRAIELDPLVPSFYLARGFSYHFMGRFEEAEIDYRRALEIEPNHVDAIDRIVDFLIDTNRLEEAETHLIQLEKLEPNTFLRAKIFAAKGEMEKALDLMGSNTNLQILSLLGMKEEAIAFLQNSLELDRDRKNNQSYYLLYKTNPVYDKVRDDSRFQKYLAEHKKIYQENLEKYGGRR